MLTFDEFIALASTAKPEGAVSARLSALLDTPFLPSESTAADIRPHRPDVNGPGLVLRVGLWNIERGLNFDLIRAALTNPSEFLEMAETGNRIDAPRREIIKSQLATLRDVDVFVLNEADWDMKRTEYRNVARELAAALHLNYADAVEFVEVDPLFDLDTEQVCLADSQQDRRLQDDLSVDRQQYHGLHGTAILSSYPLTQARVCQKIIPRASRTRTEDMPVFRNAEGVQALTKCAAPGPGKSWPSIWLLPH